MINRFKLKRSVILILAFICLLMSSCDKTSSYFDDTSTVISSGQGEVDGVTSSSQAGTQDSVETDKSQPQSNTEEEKTDGIWSVTGANGEPAPPI